MTFEEDNFKTSIFAPQIIYKPIEMKSYLFTLFLTLIFSSIFCQQGDVDLCGVYKHAVKNKTLDSISYLLNLDSTQITTYKRTEILTMRGRLRLSFNKNEINRRKANKHPEFQEALRDFSTAINENPSKNEKLKYTFRRFSTLKRYKPYYKNYKSDLNLIKSKGYNPSKFAMGISGKSKYDGEFWLGAEFSIGSGYRPAYTLKDYDGQVIRKVKYSFSIQIPSIPRRWP